MKTNLLAPSSAPWSNPRKRGVSSSTGLSRPPRFLPHPRTPLLEQDNHVRDCGVLQIEPLRSLGLQPDTISAHSQQLRHAETNRRGVRPNLRSSENQAGVDVSHTESRVVHAVQRLAQEND